MTTDVHAPAHAAPGTRAGLASPLPVQLSLLVFGAGYAAMAALGHALSLLPGLATFWPAAGLYLAALLRAPRRRWGALVAVAAVAGFGEAVLVQGQPPLLALGFVAANAAEALAGAAVARSLRRGGGAFAPGEALRDMLALGAASLAGPLAGASVGAAALAGLAGPRFGATWPVMWLVDAFGALLTAPLLLTAAAGRAAERVSRRRRWEGAAALVSCVATAAVAAMLPPSFMRPAVVLLPPLLWVALRGQALAALAAPVLVALIVSGATAAGFGLFIQPHRTPMEEALTQQIVLLVLTATTQLLAASSAERRHALAGLARANAGLEATVAARTAELRESEAFLRSVLDASTDCIKVLDAEGRLRFMNSNGQCLLEITDFEALKGRDWTLVWPEESRPRVAAAMAAALAGRTDRFEAPCPTATGTPKWWEVVVAPVVPAQGGIARIVSISRDITDRRKAAERDARLAAIVTSSTDAMVSFDAADGRIATWNPAAEELFGYSAAEAIGAAPALLVPPDLPDGSPTGVFGRAVQGERVREHETVRMGRGGRRIQVAVSATRMLGPDGHVIGVSAIFRDIGARKQAEAALAESEARFRTITEAMPQMVWAARPDGHHDFFNRRWYEFTGLPAGAGYGAAREGLLHPEDAPRLLERWRYSLRTGEPYEAEYRLRRHDGAYRWVLARALPMRNEAGAVVRWFGTSTEITDIVEAREVLARHGDELERLVAARTRDLAATEARLAQAQRMEALGQLAGGIAHDFNNVLQAIQGGAALITRRPDDPASVRRFTRMMADAAERGGAITRRLLAFSRRGDLRAEAVDAAALLGGLRDILAHTLGAAIMVEVEVAPALPPLLADKGQLETVLVNLATNARDAMPEGGTLRLAARLAEQSAEGPPPGQHLATSLRAGRYVRLAVGDTGTGIAAEVLARVSEPFFTTKPQGKGTGLGLAMARGFAEQSGGALGIRSTPGHGTTVSLWLPVAPAAAPAADAQGGPERDGAEGAQRLRVLLVDDDDLVREVTAEQLVEAGFAVMPACSGPAALAMVDAGTPIDLMVCDLSMPGMDGLAAIRAAQERRPGLPAILLTGFATDAAALAAGDAPSGRFSLLRKPVTADQLAACAELLWDARKAGAAEPGALATGRGESRSGRA